MGCHSTMHCNGMSIIISIFVMRMYATFLHVLTKGVVKICHSEVEKTIGAMHTSALKKRATCTKIKVIGNILGRKFPT